MNKITGDEPMQAVVMPGFTYGDGSYELPFSKGGLTIRQHFAAMALQGLLSNHSMVDTLSKQSQDIITQEAVFYADALIAELNKNTDQ